MPKATRCQPKAPVSGWGTPYELLALEAPFPNHKRLPLLSGMCRTRWSGLRDDDTAGFGSSHGEIKLGLCWSLLSCWLALLLEELPPKLLLACTP